MIIQSNFVPNGLELRNVITVSVFFGIAADRRIGQKRNQLSNCTTRNCIIIIIIIIMVISHIQYLLYMHEGRGIVDLYIESGQ